MTAATATATGNTSATAPSDHLSILFEPLKMGSLTLPNRFAMAALTRDRCYPTNVPTDMMVEYYRQRAKGGVGLIISEGILVEQLGTVYPHAPGIWTEEHVSAWKKITDAVHEEGSRIFAQLWHVGRCQHNDASERIASGKPIYAPSPIAARNGKFRFLPGEPMYSTPLEMSDPNEYIEIFRRAAINAKKAGFDGVEIYAGGGFLIHTFLDNTSNQRTDQWGGSAKNRARFGLEVVKAVTEIWEPGRVGVKLMPGGGYNDVGMLLEDTLETYTYFVTELDKLGLAYMQFLRHLEFFDLLIDGKRRGTPHDMSSSYKYLIKNARFFLAGGYTPAEAAEVIASGEADGVFFGRPFINNPDLPRRVRLGIPLSTDLDMAALYGPKSGFVEDIEELRKGYTDYPEGVLSE